MLMKFKGPQNKAGRWPVTMVYPGGPNAFGGFYPSETLDKLLTTERMLSNLRWAARYGEVHNCPSEHQDFYLEHKGK